jgi:hypothetical protein
MAPGAMGMAYERIPDTDSGQQSFFSRGYRKLLAGESLLFCVTSPSKGFFCLFIVAGLVFSLAMSYNQTSPPSDKVFVYQTSKDHGDSLRLMSAADFAERGLNLVDLSFHAADEKNQANFGDLCHGAVTIDPASTFQSIIGFGGAFTEASAYNYFKLPVPLRDKFLEAYFGEKGIGYSVGRIHINSCDFSLGSYSFDDVDGDFEVSLPSSLTACLF